VNSLLSAPKVLDGKQWRALSRAHRERAQRLLARVIARRSRSQRHPVEDFLFDYYRLRPGQLVEWHPGLGVGLEDADELADRRWYRLRGGLVEVDVDAFVAARRRTVELTTELLAATASRPAHLGCFGMHEWAMVYGLQQHQTRHPSLPLRLGPEGTRRVVDDIGLRCSHYDAFRFFTDEAVPHNQHQLTRSDQIAMDQPGCLHVNMDLYKYAGKLMPLVDSQLLLDTFELARDIRVVDMRASAYDLRAWGYEPVPVETPAGRAEYVRAQRGFSERAEVLRERLLAVVQPLIAAIG